MTQADAKFAPATWPMRLRAWASVAIAIQALLLAITIAGTHGWLVSGVGPNTTDFASFYAAGSLADAGAPEAAYDAAKHWAAEQKATEPGIKYQYFYYPPTYILLMAPLARLPYLASFLLFQALTFAAWLRVGPRAAGGGRTALLCLLAVPSVWWVLGLGQNSFLSAALLGTGILLLQRRPFVAGLAFGALCYKPHLAIMIPVALLACGAWRAILGAALSLCTMCAASLALFGRETWAAFLAKAAGSTGGPMDSGQVLLQARVDPTGALQILGLPLMASRLIWIVILFATVAILAIIWRRASHPVRGAALAASVLIAAPFALFYDLVTASLAGALMVQAARRNGFLPGERPILIGLYGAALLATAHPLVAASHIPFGAFCAPALLALAARRAWVERHDLA
jgi:hypothetical protein